MRLLAHVCFTIFFISLPFLSAFSQEFSKVRIWAENVTMPTYLVDPPDPNPRFYEGRAYQGAQGRVYPYPIYESLSDTRVEKEYSMVYLENEYIKVEVLPEIGGRLFGATDKTNGYVYIYKQHVIKPALIGMLGAWISGGIEWNFPHHHRATAFMPVEYQLVENPDGSATLWIGELEIRHRMKFRMGISVYPGKSYFEITFKPINRTPFVNSFLYFANTGVHTNEQYQVIFPPNTEFGTYHGKNQYVNWPISHEVYNRVDYTQGVDISWWKNHPEWTSIFAWNYEDDFIAGYDHGKEAGTLLFSNHYIGAGKKFWTWSTGPRGQMWDVALTETDGPELELMIGGYSDNQPDYSWLQPYESKYLRQYWYPIRNMGGVKNANLEAAINLDFVDNGRLKVAINTTSRYAGVRALVMNGDNMLFDQKIDIDPGHPFTKLLDMDKSIDPTDVKAALVTEANDTLVSYQQKEKTNSPMPETVKPPLPPAEIKTVEELYLAGLRLEQFYNPSLDPIPYYEEALIRDPGNYHVNIAMGIHALRRGMFEVAEQHFQTSVNRITSNHTKPRDGEGYYYLGLTQKYRGKTNEAYENLYWATWSQAFHAPAYYLLAEIDCSRGDFNTALAHLNRSLTTNGNNTKALNLKTVCLRKLGQTQDASNLANETRQEYPLNYWSLFEQHLLSNANPATNPNDLSIQISEVKSTMGEYLENYLELALDYGNCGLWEEASKVLGMVDQEQQEAGSHYPLVYYYLAWYQSKSGRDDMVEKYLSLANEMPIDYCFPFRPETLEVLNFAIEKRPEDARAYYYVGNLLFEWQPEKAVEAWEKSVSFDESNPVAWRNLGMALNKVSNNTDRALEAYERALKLSDQDQRLLYEQDLIMAASRVDPNQRLEILEDHYEVISNNNVSDALSREVMLLVQLGNYDKALQVLDDNYFKQWEGISKAYGSFVDAHLLKGLDFLKQGNNSRAMEEFTDALEYPENMMVAQPYRGGRECEVYYYIGNTYEAMKKKKKAMEAYSKSAEQRLNNNLSDVYYFKAMSLSKLGDEEASKKILEEMISLGRRRLSNAEVDFFAKFGEKDTPDDRAAEAWHLIGLGYKGLNDADKSKEAFAKAVELNINHVWAKANLNGMFNL
jgi:tetratricopeptide (TPR) repeat protein